MHNLRIWTIGTALFMGGAFGAAQIQSTSPAQAEVRKKPPTEHFKSGGERSEALLREILSTLQQIDKRLEGLETVAETQRRAATSVQGGYRR